MGWALLPRIKHETLSQMIGTTRPRICRFIGDIKAKGYIGVEDGDIHVWLAAGLAR